MTKYMTESLKKDFKIEKHGTHGCHACKSPRSGDFVIYLRRTTQAVDKTPAVRIYFVCDEKSHLSLVGYNKPVDFNLNLPKMEIDDKSYEEEDAEIESEWSEMVDNANKRRRTFYGR